MPSPVASSSRALLQSKTSWGTRRNLLNLTSTWWMSRWKVNAINRSLWRRWILRIRKWCRDDYLSQYSIISGDGLPVFAGSLSSANSSMSSLLGLGRLFFCGHACFLLREELHHRSFSYGLSSGGRLLCFISVRPEVSKCTIFSLRRWRTP